MSFRVVIQGLADGGARRGPARPPPRWGPEGVEHQGDGVGLGGEGVGRTCWRWPPCPLQPSRCSIPCVPTEAGEQTPGPCGSVPAQKRWQLCSWWRSSPGRTQRPGRIQPDGAWTAQVYQVDQGGQARKEPHLQQHLSQAERLVTPTCWGSPSLLAEVTCYFLQLAINFFENLK